MEGSSSSAADGSAKIKVMLVDDSAVIRGLISRTLERDKSIQIVGSVSNGEMAVNSIKRADPDVVILDIEMPVMGGLEAIPLLLKEKPGVKIMMCSTLSLRGADITLKAMALGAVECIAKPANKAEAVASTGFNAELLRLVKGLGGGQSAPSSSPGPFLALRGGEVAAAKEPVPVKLRHDPTAYTGKPDILAIGSSTGGPQALMTVIKDLADIDIPVVITQHMPKTFTGVLARHIAQHCGVPCHEGSEHMPVEKGNVYVAPGGSHMIIKRNGEGHPYIHLDDGPPENFCKPSADPMLRSLVNVYGRKALALILTGMGRDGCDGCKLLTDHGGRVVAQDQATSIVWGMPGAVAEAGLCTAVLPLNEIGLWVHNAVMGERKRSVQ